MIDLIRASQKRLSRNDPRTHRHVTVPPLIALGPTRCQQLIAPPFEFRKGNKVKSKKSSGACILSSPAINWGGISCCHLRGKERLKKPFKKLQIGTILLSQAKLTCLAISFAPTKSNKIPMIERESAQQNYYHPGLFDRVVHRWQLVGI